MMNVLLFCFGYEAAQFEQYYEPFHLVFRQAHKSKIGSSAVWKNAFFLNVLKIVLFQFQVNVAKENKKSIFNGVFAQLLMNYGKIKCLN